MNKDIQQRVQTPQKILLYYACLTSFFLTSGVLIFFFMVPLLYCNYRYGHRVFSKVILYCFGFTLLVQLLSQFVFTSFGNQEPLTLTSFFLELLWQYSLLGMASTFIVLRRLKWQLRLLLCTLLARLGSIPIFSTVRSVLSSDNGAAFSPLFNVNTQDGQETLDLFMSMFQFFQVDLAWFSIICWLLINWYIAILFLHRKHRLNLNKYFIYLFQKIKKDFIVRKGLYLTIVVLLGTLFFSNSLKSMSIVHEMISNLLYVSIFFYVLRGFVVLYTLYFYRISSRIDLYFICVCIIIILPYIGLIGLIILALSGLLQDVLFIEKLSKRKGELGGSE